MSTIDVRNFKRNYEYRQQLRQRVEARPDDHSCHQLLGTELLYAQLPLAEEHLREASRLDPDCAQTLSLLGFHLFFREHIEEEGLNLLRRAMSAAGRTSTERTRLAHALFESGEAETALHELETAMKEDAADIGPLLRMCHCMKERGDVEEARQLLCNVDEACFESGARDLLIYTDCLRQFEELSRAFDVIRQGTAWHPECGDIACEFANTLRDLGRTEEALAEYNRAFELDPEHSVAMNELACLLIDSGRTSDARELLLRAIDQNPRVCQPFNNLARIADMEGRPAEALEWCRKAIENHHTCVPALKAHAVFSMREGLLDEARKSLERAVELIPRDKDAKVLLQGVDLADRPYDVSHFAGTFEIPSEEDIAALGLGCDAVVLFEEALSVLHPDGANSWCQRSVVQIINPEAVDIYENIRIDWHPIGQSVVVRSATARSPDGRAVEGSQTDLPGTDEEGHVDPWRKTRSITFPELRAGWQVDVTWQIDDFPPKEEKPKFAPDYMFSRPYPVFESRLVVAVPEDTDLSVEQHNFDTPPDVTHEEGSVVRRWVLRRLPAAEKDTSAPSPFEEFPFVDITTETSWQEVVDEVLPTVLAKSHGDAIERHARKLTADLKRPEEKAAHLFDFVATQMRYGRAPHDRGLHRSRIPDRVIEELRGDCKDVTSLLVHLLRACDIESAPALVFAGDRGPVPWLPPGRFNHAIVHAHVSGRQLWMDPTSAHFAFGDMPPWLQGTWALILDPDKPAYMQIPFPSVDDCLAEREMSAQLNPDSSLLLAVRVLERGQDAAGSRQQMIDVPPHKRLEVFEPDVAQRYLGCRVLELNIISLEDLTRSVEFRYEIEIPRWACPAGNMWLVPMPWAYPMTTTSHVGWKERTRALLSGGPIKSIQNLRIAFPPSGRVLNDTYETNLTCAHGSYSLIVEPVDDHIEARREFVLSSRVVPPDDYLEFKDFIESVSVADRYQLVIQQRK